MAPTEIEIGLNLGLYNDVHDRQQTMLAYEASYFPYWLMNEHHKIVFHQTFFLSKQQILDRCNDDLTEIQLFPVDRLFPEKPFVIRWAYNNRPTKEEWDKLYKHRTIIADYRVSPLIKDGGGRICLLSLHDQDYYQGIQK